MAFQRAVTLFADSTVMLTVIPPVDTFQLRPFYDEPISLSSLCDGWRLYSGCYKHLEIPPEPWIRCVAVRGGDKRLIVGPGDFHGIVSLSDSAKVIELVSLITDHPSDMMFHDIEGKLTRSVYRESSQQLPSLPDSIFTRLGIGPPRARAIEGGFIVTRYAISKRWDDNDLFFVTEQFDTDGTYHLISMQRIPNGLRVSRPMYL